MESTWRDCFEEVQQIRGGGQGHAYKVLSRKDNTLAFLKVIDPAPNSRERRARFFRESSAYRTLAHPRIPKFICSNSDKYEDKNVELFVASEWIEGVPLGSSVRGPRSWQYSISIAIDLLHTVAYVHCEDVVHRDIKPENIILTHANLPILVDFGLGFLAIEGKVFEETPTDQQIGNRFLVLPEYALGSRNKRDPRSDVTLCLGILLFLLTGHRPRVLRDHNNHAPHNREAERRALSQLADVDLLALLDIFDRGFEQNIETRWDSAQELAGALSAVVARGKPMDNPKDGPAVISRINELLERQSEKRDREIDRTLARVGILLRKAQRDAIADLAPHFIGATSGPTPDVPGRRVVAMLGLTKASNWAVKFHPEVEASLSGDDVVVKVTKPASSTLERYPISGLWGENAQFVKLKAFLERGILTVLGDIQ